jgi:hypothetical protein
MKAGLMRFVRWTALPLLLALPTAAHAQGTARVTAEENFRRDPNGTQLAAVMPGAELTVIGEQGGWAQVELTGWIWAPSVGATSRDGFDLSVRAAGGENLRASPNGAIVARMLEGCLLERVGASSSGSWIQVRRLGWLWRASLEVSGTVAADSGAAEAVPPVITAVSPLVVHATPDGDTVATFQQGAQAQVLGRTGDWIRVRLDGWVYGPAALDSAPNLADTGDLTPAQLRADPARYRGALVRWRVQFISLRRAERARSDFEEGEPFIHARGAAGDAGFVYLAVPDNLLPIAESLQPLDYVTIVGRVRTGRSQLLGSPVVDLTDIEKEVTPN